MIKQITLSLIFSSMLLAITPAMAETTALSFENPSVFDVVSGNSVNTVTIGQQYEIRSDLTNPQTTEQSFAYAVHIVSVTDNTELANALLNGVLAPGQAFSPSLPWEPVACGDFIANFSVYDNITDMNLQAEPLSMLITIEGCSSTSSPWDEFFQSIQNFFAELFA